MSRTLSQVEKSSLSKFDRVFCSELIALTSQLRSFARRLSGNADLAEDLVQETFAKAWAARHRFKLGSNMRAWLFTILRNDFYSNRRRAGREVQFDTDDTEILSPKEKEQFSAIQLSEVAGALNLMSSEQSKALLLASVGYSYEATANICGCTVGTVKSWVARARDKLADMLDGDPIEGGYLGKIGGSRGDILVHFEQMVAGYTEPAIKYGPKNATSASRRAPVHRTPIFM